METRKVQRLGPSTLAMTLRTDVEATKCRFEPVGKEH